MNKNIFIHTCRTCIRRRLDARRLANYFSKNNHNIVYDPTKADIIFIFTCAFTGFRTNQCISRIKSYQKYDAEIIVAGCMPAIDPIRLTKIFNGKILITREIEKINDFFPSHRYKWNHIEDVNTPWQNLNLTKPLDLIKKINNRFSLSKKILNRFSNNLCDSSFSKSSIMFWYRTLNEKPFYLRISTGCIGNCSYCAIKDAIGVMKSKPLDVCVQEMRNGLNKGYKNFFLEGDDVGSYGLDIKTNFPNLLKLLTKFDQDYFIDINYMHPKWIVKYINEFEETIKNGKIRKIITSIQSANPRVLRLMNRYSDIEKIKDSYMRLKRANPKLLLETEIICGFPTETFEEFNETLEFINEVKFDNILLFPFSCKSGSKAEKIEPKIEKKDISNNINFGLNYLKKYGYDVNYAKFLKTINKLLDKSIDIYPISKISNKKILRRVS